MEIKNPSQSFLFLCDGLSAVLLAVNLQRSKHVVVERVGRIGFVRFFRLAENFRSVMVQSFDGFVLFPNTNNSRHIIGRGGGGGGGGGTTTGGTGGKGGPGFVRVWGW